MIVLIYWEPGAKELYLNISGNFEDYTNEVLFQLVKDHIPDDWEEQDCYFNEIEVISI